MGVRAVFEVSSSTSVRRSIPDRGRAVKVLPLSLYPIPEPVFILDFSTGSTVLTEGIEVFVLFLLRLQ